MKTHTWTTQKLIRFSNIMATGFGGAFENVSDGKDDNWTTQKLINMSRHLTRAYHPGL